MQELLLRIQSNPLASLRVVLTALMINLLGLGSSLYVILILNRYVTYGMTATLVTLTSGVVLALAAEYALRGLRVQLAQEIVGDHDAQLATSVYGLLLTARVPALEARPIGERAVLLRQLEQVESVINAQNLTALSDLPFSLLFLVVLALLSPSLAVVAVIFSILMALVTLWTQTRLQVRTRELTRMAEKVSALTTATHQAMDTLRHFGGQSVLMQRWNESTAALRQLRLELSQRHANQASLSQSFQSLLSVAVIAVGSILVVGGDLSVGAIIGANLIAARALQPFTRLIAIGPALWQADQYIAAARKLSALPTEPATGTVLPRFRGQLELRNLGYHGSGFLTPLVRELSLIANAGEMVAITGRNGCGKTLLARMLVGLVEPTSGQILVDGVELRQLAPAWWRKQVSYIPQDVIFLDGSIRDNLLMAQPDLDDAALRDCLAAAGLSHFVDELPQGLEFQLRDGGRNLSPGLRRRLALARALAVDGSLVIMDEPSEGLDREGVKLIFDSLALLIARQKTLIVFTHDAFVLQTANYILDLDPVAR